MSPFVKHLIDQLLAFLSISYEFRICCESFIQVEVVLKFLDSQVHHVDIGQGRTYFTPGEFGHFGDDVFIHRVQFFVGTFLILTLAELALALLLFFVVFFDLSLEFELEALGDFWTDLGQDLLDLVLGGELALFEFFLKIGAFPLEILETGPC